MLNKRQQRALDNYVYKLLKESIWENFIGEGDDDDNSRKSYRGNEDSFFGKSKKREETPSDKEGKKDKNEKRKKKEKEHHNGKKRKEVMAWLGASESDDTMSYSVNHADVMRKLWHPESQEEEDELRSLFSKKLNHELNDNGSEYDFSDEEINTLYNIKGNLV